MAVKRVLVCNKCGELVTPKPALGDNQGGPVEIKLPTFGLSGHLCENCIKPLLTFVGVLDSAAGGTVRGADLLDYIQDPD